MSTPIETDLAALPPDTIALLEHHGFDRTRFVQLVARATGAGSADNRVRGAVTAPAPEDVVDVSALSAEARQGAERLGREALEEGRVALVVLAGGMATRMGGVVKALVPALGKATFLDLRLAERRAARSRWGKAPPLWLMTSHATDAGIRDALGNDRDGYGIATFVQHLSVRVTPEGRVFRDAEGQPSLHAPGHGDLPDALRASGLLDRFLGDGGRVVMVANLDNLGATLDPLLIGLHLGGGLPVSCEVVRKVGSDRGGIPVRHDGRPVILEEFRLPPDFDPSSVRVFNTNTFLFDARALGELDMSFTFFTVRKKVGDAVALQFERLLGEITRHLPTRYLEVPRDGAASRFLPIKDNDELARRRADLEAVARDRGMLP
jgi:UTP--glucose-1-phosphate uridylyltransferase